MLINLKVKTLDAQTHEFSIDNEVTVREFKDKIAEKTNIAADQQRIIYCGRVLADEKQLKEYDVDGKVVHVAERPPPSQRGPSTSSTFANDTPTTRERPSNRGGMRNSPLFRALDGMVVGTMAIPMNTMPNNGQAPVNPLASSSSFCMNRITVARHMLECANNIAAYLEDPERGLNNTSLDILARGRWTMESTVVEVGITAADLPQNQNIVEMVQGAVSAALRRNGNANVTVVQLPTVFGSNEGESEPTDGAAAAADTMETNATSVGDSNSTAVIIEDVVEGDDDIGVSGAVAQDMQSADDTATSNSVAATAVSVDNADTGANAEETNNSTSTGTNTDENPARRRTSTRVLAEVIEQMRAVQTRLNPFIQRFYDLLQNEPTFEENDTTGRENAQRLYDRVSEAFHYMSHAQHAISDLMLDVSQPAPRFLACRPILVEQSGYVSTNNYLAAAAAANPSSQRPRTRTFISPHYNHPITITAPSAPSAPSATAGAGIEADSNSSANSNAPNSNGAVEDPVDDPVVAPNLPNIVGNAANAATQSNDDNTVEIVLQPRRGLYFANNPQVQMSRLIQAVVNSAPIDTEFHVQFLPPTILSVPMNAAQAAAARGASNAPQRANANATAPDSDNGSAAGGNESNNTSPTANASAAPMGASNQARVNTATLPTTSTQTRSTSRPQLQIGGIPAHGWNGRFIPANMMSSFDRFLPCNSHHIHEAENSNNNNSNGNAAAAGTNAHHPHGANTSTAVNQRAMRTLSDLMLHVNPTPLVGSTMTTPRASGPHPPRAGGFISLRNFAQHRPTAVSVATATTAGTSNVSAAGNSDAYRRNLHEQLFNFINRNVFDGGPINDDTIPAAINRALRWFGESLIYLPQYEKPEYDSRDSVFNILRRMLPVFIEVLNDELQLPAAFEQRLKKICETFVKRLYSVLYVCVGPTNAELYWGQLMRLLLKPVRSNFRDEALQFICIYINTDIPSTTDTADAQQFIVHRNTPTTEEEPIPMETDADMSEMATTSDLMIHCQLLSEADTVTDTEPSPPEVLPSVVTGSEPWHRNFPSDWLPIIARDLQTQTENTPTQPPFSDAYISGMSAKRRKMIQSNKPSNDVNLLIANSVRKAIQTVGVRSSTAANQSQTPDDITEAIGNDVAVQASYTEAMRTNVRDRLKKDPDYKADKYPQTAKFINN